MVGNVRGPDIHHFQDGSSWKLTSLLAIGFFTILESDSMIMIAYAQEFKIIPGSWVQLPGNQWREYRAQKSQPLTSNASS